MTLHNKCTRASTRVSVSQLIVPSSSIIEIGCDEVGRGCLSHPVVAAACIMPSYVIYPDFIKDSKKISEKVRSKAEIYIKTHALAWAIGEASVEEIDSLNILNASLLAMHRALEEVYKSVQFQHIYVGGPYFKPAFKDVPHTCVLQGDSKYINIAAASILAKCARDTMVCESIAAHPELDLAKYGFANHKGYGTPQHINALITYGITPFHRKSFAPITKLLNNVTN